MLPQPDEIIYDRRRKRLMVQVMPGGKVVLKVPLGTSRRQISSFLEQHSGWITQKKALMARVSPPA
ncbi:MAG: YgjP-like metallopeptidase domain-containing protein, partial [Anaerolineaceae bacterium]